MKDLHGGNVWDASIKSGMAPEDILDFSASINPLGVPPKARDAIRRSLKLASAYPDPVGSEIRKALAAYHGIPPENCLVGNGSTEFIYLFPRVVKPQKALIVEPAFSEYRNALSLCGVETAGFPCLEKDGFMPDLGALKTAVKKNRFDVVFIANPSNPAGVLLKREGLMGLAASLSATGTVLALDEAFIDFIEGESLKREVTRLKNCVIFRSMTKFFSMAGLRLGYMIADKAVIDRFSRCVPPWSVNTLASVAAIAALKDRSYIERTHRWLEREKAFMGRAVQSLDGFKIFPGRANYLIVRLPADMSASCITAALFKKGILVRDLTNWPGLGKSYIRVAIRTRPENKALLEAMEKAKRGLNAL